MNKQFTREQRGNGEIRNAEGILVRVAGPVVVAQGLTHTAMYDVVRVGYARLVGEVIRLTDSEATIQVYEDTSGLRVGEPVESTHAPLQVELGPGLLGSVYDGIQRPLAELVKSQGPFIARGATAFGLDHGRRWLFTPQVTAGDNVQTGDVLGVVNETTSIVHRILVPPETPWPRVYRVEEIRAGEFTVEEVIARLRDQKTGELRAITMAQRWPVRARRPFVRKLDPDAPLVTGQRIIDSFFPVARGGTAIIPGGFGTGKCVAADTPILLGDGTLVPILELFDQHQTGHTLVHSDNETWFHLNPGLPVVSLQDGKLRISLAQALYRGTADSLVRVRTRSGREAKVTPTHRLFVVTPNLTIEERQAQQLRIGDYLAVPRRVELPNDEQVLDLGEALDQARVCDPHLLAELPKVVRRLAAERGIDQRALANQIGCHPETLRGYVLGRNKPKLDFVKRLYREARQPLVVREVKGEHQSAPLRLPETFSGEFAQFLGLLLADGSPKPHGVVFYNNDQALQARFAKLARNLFNLRPRRGIAKTVRSATLSHRVLLKLLLQLGMPASGQRKSRTVRVPPIVLRSPDAILAQFLAAYFVCDGHVAEDGKEIEITTASREMQEGLAYVLLRLGILCQLRERHIRGQTYYRIYVRGKEELAKFYDRCAGYFPDNWKFARLHSYLEDEKAHYTATDIVPIAPELVSEIYKALGRPHAALEKLGINIGNYINNHSNMTTDTFLKFAEFTREPRLLKFAKCLDDIFCDPVIELEIIPGPHTVFDVTVPGSHNFVGGHAPLLLHNTVMEQTLAKWAEADIVVYIGCGERGNEMTEVLEEFPRLVDPRTGAPLMERTVLIANTSNMPVAAREASIYTGITIAEYYRDMGYDVALMADSTSRWGEALREVSGRLEEMPGEEGYPAYLATRLADFYERAGRVQLLGNREGSVTAIGAVSPPGADFSEPMTQNSLRVAGTFWALDYDLSRRRHFPAINWNRSYSLFDLRSWFGAQVAPDWNEQMRRALELLQREAELLEIAQLVGVEALPEAEKGLLHVAQILREDFLQQSAFSPIDAFCPLEKQYWMLRAILTFYDLLTHALQRGIPLAKAKAVPESLELGQMKNWPMPEAKEKIRELIQRLERAFVALA